MDFTLLWQAVVLGLVEGITEFIPVSSTGHLILASHALGFNALPDGVFEVVIQLGAILAVLVKYREKFWHVAVTLPKEKNSQRFVWNLLLAFLPAAFIGLAAHSFIKAHLFNPTVVACALIAGGIAILLIERMAHRIRFAEVDQFTPRFALTVGFIQCLAMIPGISRSGASIMGALLLGASRKAAAEFSFFLAIPTLGAASLYDLYKSWDSLSSSGLELIAVGFVVSFFSALAVIHWMIGFVSKHGFGVFAWYRIALGTVLLLLVL